MNFFGAIVSLRTHARVFLETQLKMQQRRRTQTGFRFQLGRMLFTCGTPPKIFQNGESGAEASFKMSDAMSSIFFLCFLHTFYSRFLQFSHKSRFTAHRFQFGIHNFSSRNRKFYIKLHNTTESRGAHLQEPALFLRETTTTTHGTHRQPSKLE